MTTYPINFITKVIIRIEYQPILKLKQEEPVDFIERMRDQFPRYERKESIDISIKPGEAPIVSKSPVWEFINKEKTEHISLNYQAITLIFDKYVSYELFFSKIELVYNAFNSIYRPSIIKKIGLRFINEIKLTGIPLDWEGIINNNLWCFINALPEFPTSLTRAMSQMHLTIEDHSMVFQFGIHNSEYPNKITQKEFILDYDCVSREENEPEGVINKLKSFYEDIKKAFKQSRGEKLVRIMRGEEV